jgi:hypothetical protein
MLYQTLSGNTSNVGLAIAQGGTATIKPSIVPQMIQGSIATLVPDTVSIDANGDFSFSIARTARVRLVITDSSGRICADVPLQITDDAAANLSTYMETVPPEVLRNTFINAANAAASAAAALSSKNSADADAATAVAAAATASNSEIATAGYAAAAANSVMDAETQADIATSKAGAAVISAVAAEQSRVAAVAQAALATSAGAAQVVLATGQAVRAESAAAAAAGQIMTVANNLILTQTMMVEHFAFA